MTKSLLLATLCCSTVAFAKAPPAEVKKVSLRDMALAESAYSANTKEAATATDAQVANGMLTLKDPRPEAAARSWQYFAGLTLQSFQAEGQVTSGMNQNFDLNQSDKTVMPGLEVGVMSPVMATRDVNWRLGAKVKGSYASQGVKTVLQSGYEITDTRLNSALLSAGPTVSANWNRLSWLSLNLGYQIGDLNYTQTSSNEYGQFSKHAGFQAVSYGLGFRVTENWSISTEWSQRSLKSNSEQLALQKDNFELGTRITW